MASGAVAPVGVARGGRRGRDDGATPAMLASGAGASAPKRAEDDGEASDVGVNDLGDGGAAWASAGASGRYEKAWPGGVLAGYGPRSVRIFF